MSMVYRPEPTPPKTTSPSCISNICTNPPGGINESCIELTAPQDVTVVTTENNADGTTPNLISLPSIFPPGWREVEFWSIPNGVNAGLPFISDQMVIPTSGTKIIVIAIRMAIPFLADPIILPKV